MVSPESLCCEELRLRCLAGLPPHHLKIGHLARGVMQNARVGQEVTIVGDAAGLLNVRTGKGRYDLHLTTIHRPSTSQVLLTLGGS
jgi:hypothetical protein